MTRANGGLDRDARALRDQWRIPYVVARKLVKDLGAEGAAEACARDHAERCHALEPHLSHGPDEPSTVVGGTCAVCGDVVDKVAARDFLEGPEMIVDISVARRAMSHIIVNRMFDSTLAVSYDDGQGVFVTGRRDALDRLAGEFRNFGRSHHEFAAVARHAAHRIEAALKGART